MTLKQLRENSYDWELTELWKPLALLEGEWGEWRDDFRAARICQAVGGGRIDDYLPSPWRSTEERREAEQEAAEDSWQRFQRTADEVR